MQTYDQQRALTAPKLYFDLLMAGAVPGAGLPGLRSGLGSGSGVESGAAHGALSPFPDERATARSRLPKRMCESVLTDVFLQIKPRNSQQTLHPTLRGGGAEGVREGYCGRIGRFVKSPPRQNQPHQIQPCARTPRLRK
jgi:hypothetical protein